MDHWTGEHRRLRDQWLVLRCQSGDASAFEELVREMERPLLYFAAKIVQDEATALDVLQEVWLRVFKGIRKLHDPGALRTWLYQLVRGMAIDRIRHDSSRQRAEQGKAGQFPEWIEEEEEPFEEADAAALHAALDRLSVEHREVLVLHFLEELSVAEIAAVVDCPEGTVKSRMHHARRLLKEQLMRTQAR
jgi:RNA polymerase sigma-70 factor (ECF subfamily)